MHEKHQTTKSNSICWYHAPIGTQTRIVIKTSVVLEIPQHPEQKHGSNGTQRKIVQETANFLPNASTAQVIIPSAVVLLDLIQRHQKHQFNPSRANKIVTENLKGVVKLCGLWSVAEHSQNRRRRARSLIKNKPISQ